MFYDFLHWIEPGFFWYVILNVCLGLGLSVYKRDAMWALMFFSSSLFMIPMLIILMYATFLYLFLALPLRAVGRCFEHNSKRFVLDKTGVLRYRGIGWKVALYSRNIALSITDQGVATLLGQSPDISISEALGLAAIMHEQGTAHSSPFVLKFGKFVDWLFYNKLWKIEENHIRSSIDHGESWRHTINHWHFTDADTNSRSLEN